MNEQAFKRGFFKTALAYGVNPVVAAQLSKVAFGEGLMDAVTDPANAQAVGTAGGAVLGGALGAGMAPKHHKLEGMGIGALGGGAAGYFGSGTKTFNNLMYGASPDNPIDTARNAEGVYGPPKPITINQWYQTPQ